MKYHEEEMNKMIAEQACRCRFGQTVYGHGNVDVIILRAYLVALRHIAFSALVELLPVVPRHDHVGIVIPGNKTSVSHRADEGPSQQIVFDIILSAQLIRYFKKAQQPLLQFCHSLRFSSIYLHRRARQGTAASQRFRPCLP